MQPYYSALHFKCQNQTSERIATSLEVVLVNNQTQAQPTKTQTLAQANLEGGGNTDADRRAKTPFPVLPKSKPVHQMRRPHNKRLNN